MSRFSITRERRGDWDVIRLAGIFDEQAGVNLINLYKDAGNRCLVNFRQITAINSAGIRAWVLFLRQFLLDREIEFEECAPLIVEQMNMLPSFTQKVRVRSVVIALECPDCQHVQELMVDQRDFKAAKDGRLAFGRCKKCHTAFDAPEGDDLFAFFSAA